MSEPINEADRALMKVEEDIYIIDNTTTTTTTVLDDLTGVPRKRYWGEELAMRYVLLSYLLMFCYWIVLCFFYIFVYTHVNPWLTDLENDTSNPYLTFMIVVVTFICYITVLATYIVPPFLIYAAVDEWDKNHLRIRD